MRRISLFMGALVGGFTSLALMALWYLGDQLLGLPFVPFDAFDWLARNLPGNVITLAIDTIVRVITTFNLGATSPTAKLIEQLLGLGQVGWRGDTGHAYRISCRKEDCREGKWSYSKRLRNSL